LIPADLAASTLELPASERCPIVLITEAELRHERFAMRLQAEFPELVVAWLQIKAPPQAFTPMKARGTLEASKLRTVLAKLGRTSPRELLRRLRNRIASRSKGRAVSQGEVEEKLFGTEVRRLRSRCYLKPVIIDDPNSEKTVEFVESLGPYFILIMGGGVYGSALRECARGLVLRVHEGWCPDYRETDSVDWALYHRDLSKVGSTVHILTDSVSSGPILRRSSACLAIDDSVESCLARSAALGTELMCEALRDLIQSKKARIFPQRQFMGRTNPLWHMTAELKADIRLLLSAGFIRKDIARHTTF
jgi:hypothetical protein